MQLRNLNDLLHFGGYSHGGGGPRESDVPPPRWGNQSLHTISLFFVDHFYMKSGVPHRGGLLGQPGWVSRLPKVSFLHVDAEGRVLRLTGVIYL